MTFPIASRRVLCIAAIVAMGASSSSSFAQSRDFQRGYEAGFRDGVASVQGGSGRPPGPPGSPGWRPGRIVIQDALFGIPRGPTCDARRTVQNIVDGRGTNDVFASTRLCGDPAPNRPKQLMVTYRCDNRPPVRQSVPEGQWMRIHC